MYSLVNDFDLDNYSTEDELLEVHSALIEEISILEGYRRGVKEKLAKVREENDGKEN